MSKKAILKILGAVVAIAWVVMGIALAVGVEKQSFLIIVTATAVITEIAIWIGAATMGVAVFEARAAIGRKIRGLWAPKDPLAKQD